MRQRKVKNLESRYAAYGALLIDEPAEYKGRWREQFGISGALCLEIGCGKGRFITTLAAERPQDFFIAVEGNRNVLLRALEKARRAELTNVVFVPHFITDLRDWFAEEEANTIFLNFSDPLPKSYAAKKRLTHRSKLRQYFDVLDDAGTVRFKTDNGGLFEFSLEEVRAADLGIRHFTRDLHRSEFMKDNIMTEYEERFSGLGETIKMMEIERIRKREEQDMGMAAGNGRTIPKEDKVFGISGRAKEAALREGKDAVINATIGALLDDDGALIVLSSVNEAVKSLAPEEYAEYAPIAGIPGFRSAVTRAALGNSLPGASVSVVATPGGTASLSNVVANYTCPGDKVLTHDWHWPNYKNIADELGRRFETFEMFDAQGGFNLPDFEYKVKKLLRIQDRLLLILNTPANNPTGYSLSLEEWKAVVRVLNGVPEDKKVALLLDVAYIDFAGEEEETRAFLPLLKDLNENVLSILAYSASKTFTFYGFRCAAMLCLSENKDVIEEFERVSAYSCRASWSNSPRAPQAVIAKIYEDEHLLARVDEERKAFRAMLLARGRAFEEEAQKIGLKILPFTAGFFITVPCEDPEAVSRRLEKKNAFCVPMSKGVRVSVASISEEKCRRLPGLIKAAME